MTYKDKLQLHRDLDMMFKPLLKQIYIRYRQYPSPVVRAEFVAWAVQHQHEKLLELLGKRSRRRLRNSKAKAELDMLKTKQELENYAVEV